MKRLHLTVDLPATAYRITTVNTAADFAPIAGRAAARLVWGLYKTLHKTIGGLHKTLYKTLHKTLYKTADALFCWQVKGVSYA